MREDHAFDKLWCNLDREAEQDRRKAKELKMIEKEKKKDNQKRMRKKKKQQALLDEQLKIATKSSIGTRRQRRTKTRSESPTFNVSENLSDLKFVDDVSGIPGMSGTAVDLMSDMHAPSRSSLKESRRAAKSKKKGRRGSLKSTGRGSSFNKKADRYRTLQSPDYSEHGDIPVQGINRRVSDTSVYERRRKQNRNEVQDELLTLKAVAVKAKITW